MTLTKTENGQIEFDDAGEKLLGKFYSDGSGTLTSHPVYRFAKLQKTYGKRQLDRAIQTAVSDGVATIDPV